MARFVSMIDLAPLWFDHGECIQFLFDEGLLRTRMLCPECRTSLSPVTRKSITFPVFICKRGHSQFFQSVAKGTWFDNCEISPAQVLGIVHCFAHKSSYAQTVMHCSTDDKRLSESTVSDWFSYCREVCLISMQNKCANRGKIGGPGHIVQIDECKIGRRKLHRESIVEGNWILGMIDIQTNEVRLAICPNNKRDAVTLYDLIEEHVELGSTIHTDCWRGYYGLLGDDFAAHLSVKHSLNSVKPLKNTRSINMDSRWRILRRKLSMGVSCDIHIAEYLWQLDCKSRDADPFQEIIQDIRLAFPVE